MLSAAGLRDLHISMSHVARLVKQLNVGLPQNMTCTVSTSKYRCVWHGMIAGLLPRYRVKHIAELCNVLHIAEVSSATLKMGVQTLRKVSPRL